LGIGNKENKKGAAGAKTEARITTPAVTSEELRTIKDKAEKGLKADAIVISKSDIDRMKQSTKI
jgi:hypothetical protein